MGRIFGRGLIVLLPLAVTVLIIQFIVATVDPVFAPILDPLPGPNPPGFGLLIFATIIFIVGALSHRVAEWFGRTLESVIMKMPLIGGIYLTAKQVSLSVSGGHESRFDTVVTVPFPTDRSVAIGFLTREFTSDSNREFGIVYIPTTPLPSSGFLIIIPMTEVTILDISSTEAMQMVVTGGIVVPDGLSSLAK